MAWFDRPEGFVSKSFDTNAPTVLTLFEGEDDGCPHCGADCATCPDCESERGYYPAAIAAVQRLASLCGCRCVCHDSVDLHWPGPCAGCCEPGSDCACGRALKGRLA